MIRIRLCISGMLFSSLLVAASGATATECGILRLQKARSSGTDVVINKCHGSENLAVASILQLRSSSRVWLESISDASSAAKFQIICQNESSSPVKIKVASAFLPWIKPEGFINCNAWTNDRLECKEPGSDRIALVCAIALKKMYVATHEIQRNASVTMRDIHEPDNGRTLTDREAKQLESIIENKINPKIKLCESLFDQEVAIVWTIRSTGQVTNTSIAENTREDQFANCALKVIEAYTFPSFSNDIQMYTSFK